jgi:hypothetical protein
MSVEITEQVPTAGGFEYLARELWDAGDRCTAATLKPGATQDERGGELLGIRIESYRVMGFDPLRQVICFGSREGNGRDVDDKSAL